MYIYILEKFKNIHNSKEIYKADTIIEVLEDRYKEIVKNMKKKGKNLVRKATKEEIEEYLKEKEQDITDVKLKGQKLKLNNNKGDEKIDQ